MSSTTVSAPRQGRHADPAGTYPEPGRRMRLNLLPLRFHVDRAQRLANHRMLELPPTTPAWRQVWKHPRLMQHNRLVVLVLLVNLWVAWQVATSPEPAIGTVSIAVLANFALTALIRQQRIVNLLFAIATKAPRNWPLRLRWSLGKVYHFGGLHVGGAIATTGWFVVLTWLLSTGRTGTTTPTGTGWTALITLTWLILALLILMVATALPRIRARFHDTFEAVHRYAGWTSLLLFGAQATLTALVLEGRTGTALLGAPALWVFALVTLSVASSWMTLRRVPVTYTRPSNHVAIANFTHRTPFAGSSTALARNPLKEWHHFANVPSPGREGFRLTISRAGDWTGDLINELPDKVWVKGIPTAGVGNIDVLFRRVLWIATGSGIGPCLPHLLTGETPADLVWSTRSPRDTYGNDLVEEILDVQPDAVIWDTTTDGKPDLVKLAFAAYQDSGAEAVICISNKPTTWSIVEAFERRGIPAFGAIWDS